MTKFIGLMALGALVLALLLAACSEEPTPAPTASPTPTATPTPAPTASPTPTATPTPDPAQLAMDRAALVALYNATDGDSWYDNTNWLSDRPLGEWYGVTTDNPGGRVIGLDLENNSLKGQIPPEFGQLTALETLNLSATWIFISELSALSNHSNLRTLNLARNNISDLSALSDLPRLELLNLANNDISDISPLLGLERLLDVIVNRNSLSIQSVNTHIPSLEARGVEVSHDGFKSIGGGFTVQDGPQIYNDNLFVMPTESKGYLDLAASFYQHFDDDFDFLMFVTIDRFFFNDSVAGWYVDAKNDVQGLNLDIFSNSSAFGSAGKLQGTLVSNGLWEFRDIVLHELMHRWAAYIMPGEVSNGTHWLTFGNMGGVMDGGRFTSPFNEVLELGEDRYSAEPLTEDTYSPLELYLAGFIPPEDVPEFWVAADGQWLEWPSVFTASHIKRYTIDDVIAAHGRRVPEASVSQREFRAAVILLLDEDDTAHTGILETLSADIAQFSYAGADDSERYNFYEATGGRATITMGRLSEFLKNRE